MIITVKDVSTGALAGTGTTDALGNYSVGVPSLGNCILLALKLGYDDMPAMGVIVLSEMSSNRTVNIAMGEKAAKPFEWKFSREDLKNVLAKFNPIDFQQKMAA